MRLEPDSSNTPIVPINLPAAPRPMDMAASPVTKTVKVPPRAGSRRFILLLLIVGSCVCLYAGITQPLIRFTTFYWFHSDHSLWDAVRRLYDDNQRFLAGVVLFFSIVLPMIKLLYLIYLASVSESQLIRNSRHIRTFEWLGKWSMHDVLVLAITIFYLKTSGTYHVTTLSGAYYFSAAVLMMMISYGFLSKQVSKIAHSVPPQPRTAQFWNGPVGTFILRASMSILMLAASVCLALGISLPMLKVDTARIISGSYSIISMSMALYKGNEQFLACVLIFFSIVFPLFKVLYLLFSSTYPIEKGVHPGERFHWLDRLGKYSMTDVMVLALVIFYMNSSRYTSASVEPGVYFFAASAILTMIAYGLLNFSMNLHRSSSTQRGGPR